jgi:hypothetical protein
VAKQVVKVILVAVRTTEAGGQGYTFGSVKEDKDLGWQST